MLESYSQHQRWLLLLGLVAGQLVSTSASPIRAAQAAERIDTLAQEYARSPALFAKYLDAGKQIARRAVLG